MSLLVLFLNVALANGFNYNIQKHAKIVEAVRVQVQATGNIQQELKNKIAQCGPIYIVDQKSLTNCAKEFTALAVKFQDIVDKQRLMREKLQELSPDFAPSKEALSKVLDSCDTIIKNVVPKPTEIANKYYELSLQYTLRKFEVASQNATFSARKNKFCEDLKFNVDTLAQSSVLTSSKSNFAYVYKLNQRLRNLSAIASSTSGVCKRNDNLTMINQEVSKTQKRLTLPEFERYKALSCKNAPVKYMTKQQCLKLPMTSYAIEQLNLMGGI